MTINREAVTADAVELVVRVVASVFHDEENPAWLDTVSQSSETATKELLAAFAVHRISEIVVSSRYFVLLPVDIAIALDRQTRMAAGSALKLAHETRDVVKLLTDAGIPCLVYKGIPLSVLTTGKINARGAGDIDVLVEPQNVARTHEVLLSDRWLSRYRIIPGEGRSWKLFAWLFRELPYWRQSSQVDLHWRVSQETQLFPGAAELITRGETVSIGGRDVLSFAPVDALTAAAYNFYHDGCNNLRALIDVFRLSHMVDGVPSDCTPALRQLTGEVVTFSRSLFAKENTDPSDVAAQFSIARIEALWKANSRKIKHSAQTTSLPFGEITTTAKLELASGNRVARFFHYWVARIFEFNGLDLNRGPGVIWDAFVAEVRIQLRRRRS